MKASVSAEATAHLDGVYDRAHLPLDVVCIARQLRLPSRDAREVGQRTLEGIAVNGQLERALVADPARRGQSRGGGRRGSMDSWSVPLSLILHAGGGAWGGGGGQEADGLRRGWRVAGRRGNRASMSCGEFPWDTIPPHGQFTPAPWTVLHTPPCLSTSPQPQSYSFLRQHRRTPPLPPRFIQFYIPPPPHPHTLTF